ncbi:MAG: Serine/threonine phosphatase PPP, partial [uncultured Nocardioides sp.]
HRRPVRRREVRHGPPRRQPRLPPASGRAAPAHVRPHLRADAHRRGPDHRGAVADPPPPQPHPQGPRRGPPRGARPLRGPGPARRPDAGLQRRRLGRAQRPADGGHPRHRHPRLRRRRAGPGQPGGRQHRQRHLRRGGRPGEPARRLARAAPRGSGRRPPPPFAPLRCRGRALPGPQVGRHRRSGARRRGHPPGCHPHRPAGPLGRPGDGALRAAGARPLRHDAPADARARPARPRVDRPGRGVVVEPAAVLRRRARRPARDLPRAQRRHPGHLPPLRGQRRRPRPAPRGQRGGRPQGHRVRQPRRRPDHDRQLRGPPRGRV